MLRINVTFWGVRGSTPVPGKTTLRFGGNTSCVEIEAGCERIICDAGTGIRASGRHLMKRRAGGIRGHILLSHLHWDHYTGLPFFEPLHERRNCFVICGPRAGRMGFGEALSRSVGPPYFPVPISKIPARVVLRTVGERAFAIGDTRVIPIMLNHPGGTLGWRFEFPGGRVLVHIADNEPGTAAQDTRLVEWMRGADVLIHDAQYTPREYAAHRGWGHSPYSYPVWLAREAKIKRLFLYHFDPAADDRCVAHMLRHARMLAQQGGGRLKVDAAREGASFQLGSGL